MVLVSCLPPVVRCRLRCLFSRTTHVSSFRTGTMSDAPNKIDRANCGPDIPTKLPAQSPSKFQLLRIDLVILACLAGCLLWDRLMYAAGYRIMSDLRLYGLFAALGALVLAIVLLTSLARSRRRGFTQDGIRFLVQFVVALSSMTCCQQEEPSMV